ncbi:hypothetical protein E4T56_gene4352 [Termitomyces sp. T112]|nr:hypothetical protein E4T56_gene4352 [Termitomyces sp. T112]
MVSGQPPGTYGSELESQLIKPANRDANCCHDSKALNRRMCYMRFLYNIYSCNHRNLTRRERVDCHGQTCISSSFHIKGKHDCRRICPRFRMEEVPVISGVIKSKCPTCIYGLH